MITGKELALGLLQTLKQAPEKETEGVFSAFVEFLEEHSLMSHLPSVVRYLESYAKKESDFNTLFIETPFPISEALTKNIQARMEVAKETPVEMIINEELLGGFRASYQGVITDASIKHNLQVLKKQLTK